MTAKTAAQTFYEDQVRYCETKDIAGIRSHYTDDAVLVSFDNQIFGGDAIAEYFSGYLDRMAGLKLASTDRFVETDDTIFSRPRSTSMPAWRAYTTRSIFVMGGPSATSPAC